MGIITDIISGTSISADTLYLSGNSITQSYKVYTALLTQTGTSAPTAIVLENTLGFDPSWEYFEPGKYGFNFPLPPDYSKIFIIITSNNGYNYFYNLNTDYEILIRSISGNDNELENTPFEIRVYN